MSLKRQISIILIKLGVVFASLGQEIHYTQFNMSPFSVNPSYIGQDKYLKAIAHYRNQNINIGSVFRTSAFSFVLPFAVGGKKGFPSAGINVLQDDFYGAATFSHFRVSMAFAYGLYVGRNAQLTMGIQWDYNTKRQSSQNFSTGSQYVNGRGFDPSQNNGEEMFSQSIQYHAIRPGISYQKFSRDEKLNFMVVGSITNLANTHKGYFGKDQPLFPGLVLNTKAKVLKSGASTFYPELLYYLENGNQLATLGMSVNNVFKSDSLKNVELNGSAWVSSNSALAVGMQLLVNNIKIGVSYQTPLLNVPTLNTGNVFEIVLAYNKLMKPTKAKPSKSKSRIVKTSKTKKRKNKARKPANHKTAFANVLKTKKLQKISVNDTLSPVINSISFDTLIQTSGSVNSKIEDDYTLEIDGKVYTGKFAEPIYFKKGDATLSKEFIEQLEEYIWYLNNHKNAKLLVFGHTDDSGSSEINKALSEKRAKAVKSFIISKGISPNRVIEKGHGHEKPLHPNDSDDNRSKNRRVELVIFK